MMLEISRKYEIDLVRSQKPLTQEHMAPAMPSVSPLQQLCKYEPKLTLMIYTIQVDQLEA